MTIRRPDYYDRFQCIAGACSDSCCIGWKIDVDEERREKYRRETGELGDRLRNCIDWEEGHFILQGKEERCPFLNEENLCDLIIGLGEESLCEICREHPRYYEWYDGLTEVGVGLCCEAAARLVLGKEEKAQFVECEERDETEDDASESEEDLAVIEVLMNARETAYAILQNRKTSIWKRLEQFLSYIEEIQEALDFGNLDEIEESAEYYCNLVHTAEENMPEVQVQDCVTARVSAYRELLSFCDKLEAIDEVWPVCLEQLKELLENSEEFYQAEQEMLHETHDREYEYEHLAVYFVYRYFMKCRTDGDVYSRGCLAVFCIMLIRLLDTAKYVEVGSLSKEDRVQNAKDCSKEVEYSEDNLARLADLFWNHGFETIAGGL